MRSFGCTIAYRIMEGNTLPGEINCELFKHSFKEIKKKTLKTGVEFVQKRGSVGLSNFYERSAESLLLLMPHFTPCGEQ